MQGTIAVITPWAPNFAPRNWAFCNGALLPISSNTALFAILGTTYGGDGRTTVQLPDLTERVAVGQGRGPGLSTRVSGARFGSDTTTLTTAQIPSHGHDVSTQVSAVSGAGTTNVPGASVFPAAANLAGNPVDAYGADDGTTVLGGLSVADSLPNAGGGLDHNNLMPYQVLNYIICLSGTFPTRN